MRLLLILLLTAVATAAIGETVGTIGLGQDSCGDYLQSTTGPQGERYKQAYQQWVWGFMSGHNWANQAQQSRGADAATVIAFLNNFCQRNPLLNVNAGTWALVAETGGKPVLFSYQK